jgi:quercetin dioxygenase-like cupin family protein
MNGMPSYAEFFQRIAEGTPKRVLDIFGTTVEFLTLAQAGGGFCVMRGVLPPGVAVPLHSHDDDEDFLILEGTQQVLAQHADGLEWTDAHVGDYIHIPGGTMHAHRNVSPDRAVDLLITTVRLGEFFAEIGRPVTESPWPLTPSDVEHFVAVAAKYGYRLGTPEENAAVGIELPKFAAGR